MRRAAGTLGAALGGVGRAIAFVGLFLLVLAPLQLLTGGVSGDAASPAAFLQTGLAAVAALVAGAVLLRVVDGRRPGALGIAVTRQTGREIGLGLAVGTGAILAATAFLAVIGLVRWHGEAGTAADWAGVVVRDFGIFAVAAFAEEAMFRGYGYQALVRGIGAVPATLLASGLFAVAHAQNPNVGTFALVNIFLAGVLLSAAYLRTLSLWFATAVHLGWNWGMASLLDLPVSGITAFDTPLYEATARGPDWVSGGAFGPEAGLAGSVAFAAALIAVLRMRRLEPSVEQRALRPLVDDRNTLWGTG